MNAKLNIVGVAVLLMFVSCGGGGSSDSNIIANGQEAACLDFSLVTNGSNSSDAESYWSCATEDYNSTMQLYDDGTGVSSLAGVFTWRETDCNEASMTYAGGESTIYDINGSIDSGIFTFKEDSDDYIGMAVSCFLVD